jgi:hypothetical protein
MHFAIVFKLVARRVIEVLERYHIFSFMEVF